MKILVRVYNEDKTSYVWKKVKSEEYPISRTGYRTEDGYVHSQQEIIKISNDYRTSKYDYVMCENCGKIVKRSEVEEHFAESEKNANCLKCDWLRLKEVSENKKTRLLKDGTVAVTTICDTYCTQYSWHSGEKTSEIDKNRKCKFYKCRRAGVREIYRDFFCEYPNPYQNFLTEKAIIKAGWVYTGAFGLCRTYESGNLIAYFDSNGILVHYAFRRRSSQFDFTYSDKYDKFFDYYGEFDWGGAAEKTIKSMEKKIRKLYKESEGN